MPSRRDAALGSLMGMVEMLPEASTFCYGHKCPSTSDAHTRLLLADYVRVGLEESIFYRKGAPAASKKFVKGMVRLSRELD
jgi:uncharacterized protein (DUF849 family)